MKRQGSGCEIRAIFDLCGGCVKDNDEEKSHVFFFAVGVQGNWAEGNPQCCGQTRIPGITTPWPRTRFI